MGLFNLKTEVANAPSKESFSARLGSVKSMFKRAYDSALMLDAEMQTDIDEKNKQILALNTEIGDIKVTQIETQSFMSNLEKFI